jgi:hypothetical protein
MLVEPTSLQTLARIKEIQQNQQALHVLFSKNVQIFRKMHEKIQQEKQQYDETIFNFSAIRKIVAIIGSELLSHMDEERMENIITTSLSTLHNSHTTFGLIKNMHILLRRLEAEFDIAQTLCANIKEDINAAYLQFHHIYGLKLSAPPHLISRVTVPV